MLDVLLLVSGCVFLEIRKTQGQPVQVELELAPGRPVQVPRGLCERNDVAEVSFIRIQEVVAVQVFAVLESVVVRTVRPRIAERPGRRVRLRLAPRIPQARVVLVAPHADDRIDFLVEFAQAGGVSELVRHERVFVDGSDVHDESQALVEVVPRRSVEFEELAGREVDPRLRENRGHGEPARLPARGRIGRVDPENRLAGARVQDVELWVDLVHEQRAAQGAVVVPL